MRFLLEHLTTRRHNRHTSTFVLSAFRSGLAILALSATTANSAMRLCDERHHAIAKSFFRGQPPDSAALTPHRSSNAHQRARLPSRLATRSHAPQLDLRATDPKLSSGSVPERNGSMWVRCDSMRLDWDYVWIELRRFEAA
jgi:hypothetical protein